MSIVTKLLGAGQNKLVKKYRARAEKITAMEPDVKPMSNKEIEDEIESIRQKLLVDQNLDKHMDRVFALSREYVYRKTGERAFDVQLMAAMAISNGQIGEMATGSGKTRTSNFPVLLNAMAGKQVHVVTVNEYLAKRDADACREALGGLGVTVGYIYNQQPPESKKQAYSCDVVYGTPSEFGFDYLRDNMVSRMEDKVQPNHDYAIIDEVDSILIDEARTPLIISGAGNQSADLYQRFAAIMPSLIEGIDFEKDEKRRQISATESGLSKVEAALGVEDLYSDMSGRLPGHLMNALKAQFLFHRDKDYIVTEGEVKIVDEFTGRIMEGRRWSEGLHQAIEAKEHVEIKDENQTLATVTLQNFFRLYDKLSGMTGTAMTEDSEFRKTYNVGVVAIPTKEPVIRVDAPDLVYRTIDAKFDAIADEIARRNAIGQPILVGTVSVEMSEKLSRLLKKRGIKHNTLNAKFHEQEAHIVAQAGRLGAVTIATNMAGRGTDIILGGNPKEMLNDFKRQVIANREPDPETGIVDEFIPQAELDEAKRQIEELCSSEQKKVLEAGGLCVIGTERHDSRRIDNQLRGRSGRQGDPGYSQFYISLEDDLMRLFGQDKMERISQFMLTANIPDNEPIDTPMVSKSIERAQHTVEQMNFEMRKNVLEYDDVMNEQRKAIYSERDLILRGEKIADKLERIKEDVVSAGIAEYCDWHSSPDDWDWTNLRRWWCDLTGSDQDDAEEFLNSSSTGMGDISTAENTIKEKINSLYDEKVELVGQASMDNLGKSILLKTVDASWKDHLAYMDYLKSGIGLRGYGQREPLTEYRDEAYQAFEFMVDTMYTDALRTILRIKPIQTAAPVRVIQNLVNPSETTPMTFTRPHSPRGSVIRDVARAKETPFMRKPPTGGEMLGGIVTDIGDGADGGGVFIVDEDEQS